MTILVTGDLHLNDHARDEYRHAFMRRLPTFAAKHDATLCIILGDITDAKDRHSAWLVNMVVEHIVNLSKTCDVIILRGNHDYIRPDSPFYEFVKHLKGYVRWVNDPIVVKRDDLGTALFLPHTTNYQRDWKGIDFKVKYDWIFAHNTFKGAKGEHGHLLDGIPIETFPTNARVISGDVHVPQRIGPLRYVGAPFLIDFGDDYVPRCLLLDEGKIKALLVDGAQKRLVEIHTLTELVTKTRKFNAGDILKVRVMIDPDNYQRWPELHGKVRVWGEQHGFVMWTIQPQAELLVPGKAMPARTARSDDELLQAYAKRNQLDEQTLKVGKHIMERS